MQSRKRTKTAMPAAKPAKPKTSTATPAAKSARPEPSLTADHTPQQIPPESIRPNTKNPRLTFPQGRIEALAESVETVGVLVPLTVFRDRNEAQDSDFVLLDGERRLRAAKLVNLPTVPAFVVPKPEGIDNTLRMFNIHMMRDEWGEMATALALKEVMVETGEDSDSKLSKMTGLSTDRVKNMRRVLAFPDTWHERVLADEVPFQFLVELDKAVLAKTKDAKKATILDDLGVDALRDFFLSKYDKREISDVVDLRKVGTLIETAASPKMPQKARERAQRAVSEFLRDETTIEDAYQFGAAGSIELKSIVRDLDQLPERLQDLEVDDIDDEEKERLTLVLFKARKAIDVVLKGLK